MELLTLYNAFNEASSSYLEFVEQLVTTDFAMLTEAVINGELEAGRDKFEKMMEKVGHLEVEETQVENLKDLRYLLMDSVFLASDLAHFYKLNEVGRFKMRALNAINKKRRAELFKEEPSGTGSCPMHLM